MSSKAGARPVRAIFFAAINERRTIALDRLIFALGIPHIGETNARLLARAYGSASALRDAMRAAARGKEEEAHQELMSHDGIGPIVAEAIVDFFGEPHNVEVFDKLLAEVEATPLEAVRQSPVSGKTVVFTGALEKMTREEAKAMAEKAGRQGRRLRLEED